MKLLYCNSCKDVVKLHMTDRTCLCGASGGHYLLDGLHAVIWGNCVPLGFDNRSFNGALFDRPIEGMGKQFTAFVIPIYCDTVYHKESK